MCCQNQCELANEAAAAASALPFQAEISVSLEEYDAAFMTLRTVACGRDKFDSLLVACSILLLLYQHSIHATIECRGNANVDIKGAV